MSLTNCASSSSSSEELKNLRKTFSSSQRIASLRRIKPTMTRHFKVSSPVNQILAQIITLIACLVLILSISTKSSFFQAQAIKLQPEGKEKFHWSGEQFVITCQNTNNIKNVKIRWYGPTGIEITDDRSRRVSAVASGPHSNRLTIMNSSSEDDGKYRCTLGSTDDRNPREQIEFNLKIYKATNFRDTQKVVELAEGSKGILTCKVEFDPSVVSSHVSWFRNQIPIEMFNDSTYSVSEYDNSRQASQLTISPLRRQHDGIYNCRADAVTPHLSKVTDYDIHLVTTYAPTFDSEFQTVWVERAQNAAHHQPQQQYQHATNTYGNGHSQGHRGFPKVRPGKPTNRHSSDSEEGESNSADNASIARIELNCSCQAHPQAGIVWEISSSNQVVTKGNPAHVLDVIEQIDGKTSTSILVIGYNLDAEWPHGRDKYVCSASNSKGRATKTFIIQQGDPPPAFHVGDLKQYNSQDSKLRFTLLGPNLDPERQGGDVASSRGYAIVPPVDSFRITNSEFLKSAHWTHTRRSSDIGVQWSVANQQDRADTRGSQYSTLAYPMNFSVSLSKLPTGNQKLYLEAHNAVGWSPNSTYLGEYYIVSGSASVYYEVSQLMFTLKLLVSLAIGLNLVNYPITH